MNPRINLYANAPGSTLVPFSDVKVKLTLIDEEGGPNEFNTVAIVQADAVVDLEFFCEGNWSGALTMRLKNQ